MASRDRRAALSTSAPPQQVRLAWLLSALGILLGAALGSAYLSLCLLFVQGQWQLLYHPTTSVRNSPADAGLAFQPVEFSPDDKDLPQLTGWWLPAPAAGAPTVLYLHDSTGSLGDTLPALTRLHTFGCNIFAIDYRGYGRSAPGHPSEARMIGDARAAIRYLLETRQVPARSLVLWGTGVGATVAAEADQAGLPLILEAINPTAAQLFTADPRTRFLPMRLLRQDHLDAKGTLAANAAPKLFLSGGGTTGPASWPTQQLFVAAAAPKHLTLATDSAAIRAFLARSPQLRQR